MESERKQVRGLEWSDLNERKLEAAINLVIFAREQKIANPVGYVDGQLRWEPDEYGNADGFAGEFGYYGRWIELEDQDEAWIRAHRAEREARRVSHVMAIADCVLSS